MKKTRKAVSLLALLLVCGVSTVYAAQEGAGQAETVYDSAALLTESERSSLHEQIISLEEKTGWDIYAVTTSDAEGKSATEYADDFYDAHSPEQENGAAVLIDMDNREIAVSTSGEAIRCLTDDRIDGILDDAYEDVSDEAYSACLGTMVEGISEAYDAGIPAGQYNYDTETGEVSRHRTVTWMELLIAVILAVGSGAAVYAVVVGRYRLRFGGYQYDFHTNGTLTLDKKEDRFVDTVTTHRRIQTQSGGSGGGGGRSSTHRSSSGRNHGGGSRKF